MPMVKLIDEQSFPINSIFGFNYFLENHQFSTNQPGILNQAEKKLFNRRLVRKSICMIY